MDDRSNSRSIIKMSCLSFIKAGMLWPVSGGPKSATATMNAAKEPAMECLAWSAVGLVRIWLWSPVGRAKTGDGLTRSGIMRMAPKMTEATPRSSFSCHFSACVRRPARVSVW